MFQKLARICLYAVPLVVVLVLPTTFFPFIGGKYYAFRALVTLAATFTILGWAIEDEPLSLKEQFWPILRSPVTIGFMLLTAAILLATAFAYDPHGAFWSNFERGEGSFQFIHYLVFFVLVGGLFTAREHWKTMLKTSVVAAAGVALYGLLAAIDPSSFLGPYAAIKGAVLPQYFGERFGGFLQRLAGDRFQGSLGNAAYVTPYFIFIAAYIAWLWTSAQRRLRVALVAVPALVLAAVFFVLSGTRGAFVGLLAGAFVAAIYYAFRERRYRWWVAGLLIAGLVAFGGLFIFRNNPHVTKLPGARLLQLDVTQLTAQTRFWTWESAWKGFKDRPVFGYGPENFPVAFDLHFDSRHFDPQNGGETWFDRAHNIVLDYLATTGAVGLAAWLAFIVLLFVQVARAIRKHSLTPMQEAILLGLPVAYVVQSMLLFDVLPIFLNVGIIAAFAVAATRWQSLPAIAPAHVRHY